MAVPAGVLKAGYTILHATEDFSDCKVICGPYQYNLHKAILSGHSGYFRIALKPGTFKEGKSSILELKAKGKDSDEDDECDDPEIFKLMIEYIYHFDYLRGIDFGPPEKKKREETGKTWKSAFCDAAFPPKTWLVEHAKVFAIAVKYRVDGLCDLAAAKFEAAAAVYWDSQSFMHSISIVHRSTSEDVTQLRDIVANILHDHTDVFKNDERTEDLVSSMAGLVHALLKRKRYEVKKFVRPQAAVPNTR